MKKIITILLSIITLFGIIGLTACGEPEKTDEQIAMEYFNEFKGATYKPNELNENGWRVHFCHNGQGQVLSNDYMIINNDLTCSVLAYSNTYIETEGTFKLAFSKMQEEPYGSTTVKKYYFDLLENTTTITEFYVYEYDNVKKIIIDIIDR